MTETQLLAPDNAAAALEGSVLEGAALDAPFPQPFPLLKPALTRRGGPFEDGLAALNGTFTDLGFPLRPAGGEPLAQPLHPLDSHLPPRLIDTGRRRGQRGTRDAYGQDESGPDDSFHGVIVPPDL